MLGSWEAHGALFQQSSLFLTAPPMVLPKILLSTDCSAAPQLTAPDTIGEPRNVVDDSIKGWMIEVEGLGIPIRSRAKAHATISRATSAAPGSLPSGARSANQELVLLVLSSLSPYCHSLGQSTWPRLCQADRLAHGPGLQCCWVGFHRERIPICWMGFRRRYGARASAAIIPACWKRTLHAESPLQV